jgi:transposase
LGRSKGGLTTKIHTVVDALGNPVRFVLTGGNRNDITQTEALLDGLRADYVLADKGYDGQNAIAAVEKTGAIPVIPRRKTTATYRRFDADLYKERHRIENFFSKLKHYRGVATRYCKRARNFASFLYLTAALIWLR